MDLRGYFSQAVKAEITGHSQVLRCTCHAEVLVLLHYADNQIDGGVDVDTRTAFDVWPTSLTLSKHLVVTNPQNLSGSAIFFFTIRAINLWNSLPYNIDAATALS